MMDYYIRFVGPYFRMGWGSLGSKPVAFYTTTSGIEFDKYQFASVVIVREPNFVVRQKPVGMMSKVEGPEVGERSRIWWEVVVRHFELEEIDPEFVLCGMRSKVLTCSTKRDKMLGR